MSFQKQQTTVYIKEQVDKDTPAVVTGTDAVQITGDSTLVKPTGNQVESGRLRPGARLGAKKYTLGKFGNGPISLELAGSGTAGLAPEYGKLLKSLLGSEVVVADTSVEYSINADGDTTWLTVDQYEDGARYLATAARCRALSFKLTNNELSKLDFTIKSLSCEESDATDPNTPIWDDQEPLAGVNCTITVDGVSTNVSDMELTVENSKETSYCNDGGLGDLPADSTLSAAGSITREMADTSPLTAFFNGALADIVIGIGSAAGNKCTITLSEVQYDQPEASDNDGDLEWSVPFSVTGGVSFLFE